MADKELENEQVLDDIRNIVASRTTKEMLNLTNVAEEKDTKSAHSHLLQDINESLNFLDSDLKRKTTIQSMVTKLKRKKEAPQKITLEDLVNSMLEPKIQDWLNDNLKEIVEKKIKEIVDEQ